MLRPVMAALSVCAVAGALSLTGCGNEAKVKKTETVQTPGGTTTTTTEKTIESSGNNPPPNSSGQSVPK